VQLSLEFGAGEMYLSPGSAALLVDGTATYNIEDFKPQIVEREAGVLIKQGDYGFSTAPTLRNLKNIWDLKLGDFPTDLSIRAGAYKGRLELGGLSLASLSVEDGAAEVELAFSEPNQTEMSVFRYQTGASNVTLEGLGNANFNSMTFDSGAGNYTLDFSGQWERAATITIESGLSNLTLIIPEDVNAHVTVDGGLTNVSTDRNWSRADDSYSQDGSGPAVTIIVRMGAGNLTITD
jgi:hypothetical protein